MKKIIPIIILSFTSLIWFSCEKNHLADEFKSEEELSTRSSEPFLDYLASPDFEHEIVQIGIEKLKNDKLNLEVLDYHSVVQTDLCCDPIGPDEDLDDLDDPPSIVIRVYSTGQGLLPAGVYFLDLDTGRITDILGNYCMTIPPWG